MATKEITREEIRKIARAEDTKVIRKLSKEITILQKDIDFIKQDISAQCEILKRLERLLLGELGTDANDTLKARATFAYQYAKRNTDARIIERAEPAIKWFEDMAHIEPGQKESKLETLGRMIGLFGKIEWILAILGITTLVNALPAIRMIVEWLSNLS